MNDICVFSKSLLIIFFYNNSQHKFQRLYFNLTVDLFNQSESKTQRYCGDIHYIIQARTYH